MNLSKTLTIFLAICQIGISQVALGQSSTRTTPYSDANVRPSLPTQLPGQLPGGLPPRGTLNDQGRTFPNSAGRQTSPTTAPSTGNGFPGSVPAYSATTDQKLADLAPEKTHGWEYDENSELVYIIQVSPGTAEQMLMESKLGTGKTIYASSTMPIELVGRARKITMQIGTEILPRQPSLEQLRRTKRLDENQTMAELDNIGPGSMARVEPDGSAIPVQRTLPASPNYTRPTTGSTNLNGLPSGGLDATRGQLGGQTGAGSQFLSDAGAPASSLPDYSSPSNPMRENFGSSPRSGIGSQNPAAERELTAQLPDYSNSASNTDAYGQPQYDSYGRPNPRYRGQAGPGYSDPPSMTGSQPRGTSTFGQAPSAPDFGNRSAPYEQSLASAGTNLLNNSATRQSNDDYLNRSQYDSQNRGLPSQTNDRQDMQVVNPTQQLPGYDRSADIRNDPSRLPNALPRSTFPSTAQSPNSDSAPSPSELAERQRLADAEEKKQEQADAEAAARQNQTNLITLFCVLSLVVNCYLFMLIRKLLTRYRTLLTNVRSQTA